MKMVRGALFDLRGLRSVVPITVDPDRVDSRNIVPGMTSAQPVKRVQWAELAGDSHRTYK